MADTAGWRNRLRVLWEQYLLDGHAMPLLAFIEAHPQSMAACGHEYPHLHRVCDITLSGKAFRVTRCFTCGEELSFCPITTDIHRPYESGVPHWLSGDKLAKWIEDVSNDDPKEPTDWERYR